MAEFAAAGGDSGRAGEAAVSDAVKLRKMIDMTRAITANFARINASLKKILADKPVVEDLERILLNIRQQENEGSLFLSVCDLPSSVSGAAEAAS